MRAFFLTSDSTTDHYPGSLCTTWATFPLATSCAVGHSFCLQCFALAYVLKVSTQRAYIHNRSSAFHAVPLLPCLLLMLIWLITFAVTGATHHFSMPQAHFAGLGWFSFSYQVWNALVCVHPNWIWLVVTAEPRPACSNTLDPKTASERCHLSTLKCDRRCAICRYSCPWQTYEHG